jgi:hypothetical protein
MENSVTDNMSDVNQTQAAPSTQTEKMVPQSQVNEIVGHAKREAAERAVEAYKRQASAQYENTQQQQTSSHRGLSEDDVKRMAGDEIKKTFGQLQEEAQERANIEAANRIVGVFKDKIVAGKGRYDDFDTVTGNVAMQHYPNVVQLLAEQVDNTADVLYHLANNRDKLYRLEALSQHNTPDAIHEIKRLSESIKANEQSLQAKNVKAPLSQQRPSNTGTDPGNALSMADLKRKYRG